MKWSGTLRIVCLCGLLGSAPSASAASDISSEFRPLWNMSPQATSESRVLEHPAYVLALRNQRVRAVIRGSFDPTTRWPEGTEVILQGARRVDVWATRTALREIATYPQTVAIHPPHRFVATAVTSEALPAMNLGGFQQTGNLGQGVRVAVIDLGFQGWESLLGTELPSGTLRRSFVNSGNSPFPTAHGTACAEIIHDVASQAQLYLLEVAETTDFAEAVKWCIDNDIHVVSMSLAFFAGPRDGSGFQAQQVNKAADAGIVFVISSGNEAASHWQGTWTDADGDSTLDVGSGTNVIGFDYRSGSSILVVQTVWDRWPSTAGLSFDLEVYRDSARTQLIANSSGSPSLNLAHRLLVLDNLQLTRYYVAIKHRFGAIPQNLRFDVYIEGDKISVMSPRDAAGSLTSPADAKGAVAVGAYDFGVATPGATPIHNYSSQGPTWDGRAKPELVAGSGVSTVSFGNKAFFGTSASAPHVAGAAAVLTSASVHGALFTYVWGTEDMLRLLRVNSVDFGAPGRDNTYGWGGVVMPPASSDPADFVITSSPNPFNARVTLSFALPPGTSYGLRVFDILGRMVWHTEGLHATTEVARVVWNGRTSEGAPLASGVYFFAVDTDTETFQGRAVLLK